MGRKKSGPRIDKSKPFCVRLARHLRHFESDAPDRFPNTKDGRLAWGREIKALSKTIQDVFPGEKQRVVYETILRWIAGRNYSDDSLHLFLAGYNKKYNKNLTQHELEYGTYEENKRYLDIYKLKERYPKIKEICTIVMDQKDNIEALNEILAGLKFIYKIRNQH